MAKSFIYNPYQLVLTHKTKPQSVRQNFATANNINWKPNCWFTNESLTVTCACFHRTERHWLLQWEDIIETDKDILCANSWVTDAIVTWPKHTNRVLWQWRKPGHNDSEKWSCNQCRNENWNNFYLCGSPIHQNASEWENAIIFEKCVSNCNFKVAWNCYIIFH